MTFDAKPRPSHRVRTEILALSLVTLSTSDKAPVGVRNSDHPCDLRLGPSWPPARDGPIAPSRGPAPGAPAREPNVDEV